jgi:EpsI family protein
MVAAPSFLRGHTDFGHLPGAPVLTAEPVPGWTWVPQPMTSWQPHFQNAAATLHGQYQRADGATTVGVYVGYYRDQRPGRQLVTSVNAIVQDGHGSWSRTASSTTQADGQTWRTAELRGLALQDIVAGVQAVPRLRVWSTSWIDGRLITSDWQAKLYGVWQTLSGRGDDGAVVILYVDKAAAGADDATLRDFLHTAWPRIDTALRDVRARNVTPQR